MLLFREYFALVGKINAMEGRLSKLEQIKNKRMPYEAMENLLDARAALDKELDEFKYFASLIENAKAHMDKAMKIGTKEE